MNGSPTLSFGSYEMKKIAKGALIAAAGAVLSYFAVQIIPTLQTTDYAWLIPLLSVGVNSLKELLVNNQKS